MRIKEKKHHWAKERERKKNISKIKITIRPVVMRNILIILFVGVVIYSFVFSNFLEITEIEIKKDGIIPKEEVGKIIDREIDGKYLKVVSKKNFIFFNSGNIERKLKSDFKKIKTVDIKRTFPNKVTVEIEERNLILSLCSRGDCYFIDERGYAYEKMNPDSNFINRNETIELIDESGKEIIENEYVLLPSYIEFIVMIADKLKKDIDIEILSEYRTKSRISEELIVQTRKGWDIYFSAKTPIEKSIQTLKTLLNRHLFLRDLHELEYIDLRSENKVFYRMRGGVTQEEEEVKKEEDLKKEVEENKEDDKEKKEEQDNN